DERDRVAEYLLAAAHCSVGLGKFLKGDGASEARIDLSRAHKVVVGTSLRIIGAVRSLKALLPRPVIPQINHGVEPGSSGADDDHSAGTAQIDTRRDRSGSGMLEHNRRILSTADDVPEVPAERPHPLRPCLLAQLVIDTGRDTPMIVRPAVQVANGTILHGITSTLVIRDDS